MTRLHRPRVASPCQAKCWARKVFQGLCWMGGRSLYLRTTEDLSSSAFMICRSLPECRLRIFRITIRNQGNKIILLQTL
jgi:hypothetical protein